MDPTLLHHSSPFDFESKYLGQERSFSNPSYPTNDFTFSSRRPQNALTTGAPAPGVALPTNSSLDFNGSSLVNDTPFHPNSHLLLSPPDSNAGSVTTSGNAATSSLVYTTLPKPYPSNACAPDHFSSASNSVLSSNWAGPSMMLMDRPRGPAPLSPPLHPPANGMGTGPLSHRPVVDRLPHTYQNSTISPGIFHPSVTRYPSNSSYRLSMNGSVLEPPYHTPNMSSSFQENQGPPRQDGPPFGETNVLYPVLSLRGVRLVPEITAHIQKGFFQVDRKWTCYRRNYFAVFCSFQFKHHAVEPPLYINTGGQDECIQGFAVSISAKTASSGNGESESRGLVQHTPKRDKATESIPGRQPISPTMAMSVGANNVYPATGHLFGASPHVSANILGHYGGYENSSAAPVPPTHTFERIQFQKATANNGKRRAQQQYFLVVVELSANIARNQGEEDWVVIATKESDPMVVRGRSPGHYKDNGRRDSQTSMDPDRGTGHGHGADAGPGAHSLGSYNHTMDWIGQRSSGHFGGSSYRQAVNPGFSPASMASSSTLTGTATDAEPSLSDGLTTKSSCTLPSDRSALTPLSEDSEDMMFSLDRSTESRKRPFEDDVDDVHLRFPLSGPFTDSMPPIGDFSAVPYSKLLCASS